MKITGPKSLTMFKRYTTINREDLRAAVEKIGSHGHQGIYMAIKKSDLYSSLWASCDELRGGMDASQYKDYVLFMLLIKYISEKYGDLDDFAPAVTMPEGAQRLSMNRINRYCTRLCPSRSRNGN
jgi:hypothetical protein